VTRVITAAGGLVFRETSKGKLRILVVHRPSYDDWSLPKGKTDEGETPDAAAIREVLEETGYHCRLVAPIGSSRYRMSNGIKEVSWFAMRPLPDSPGFRKNREVDEIKWLPRKKAVALLDYVGDRDLLRDPGLDRLANTGTLRLLRHGSAGERAKWKGIDALRPLTKKGHRQAKAIARSLRNAGIERIYSSPYTRCVQTVEPLAKAIGAKVEEHDALAEGSDVEAATALVEEMRGMNAILCTHGDVIPAVINRLMLAGLSLESRFYCSKGSIWEVEKVGGRYTTARYLPPPKV
jgi:8-oxo-dGTP diphosphatase